MRLCIFATLSSRLFITLALVLMVWPARGGQMTITPAGQAEKFTLSTYATGFATSNPTTGIGPFGIAYQIGGGVLVADADGVTGSIYQLPNHTDGQVANNVVASYPGIGVRGLAQIEVGNAYNYYMTEFNNNGGMLVQVNQNGGFVKNIASITDAVGLTAFPSLPTAPPGPLTGHLFVTSTSTGNIFDVDPSTGKAYLFGNVTGADGLTFSPDGKTLYVASENASSAGFIRAFDVSSYIPGSGGHPATNFWDTPLFPSKGLDGISIGLGTLNGYIFANFNDGTFWQYGLPGGPNPGAMIEIGAGGSRGDFVALDPSVYSGGSFGFPSLLITQSDRILRLDPPGSGFYTSEGSSYSLLSVPEPNSIVLLALGVVSVIFHGRRRRHRRGVGTISVDGDKTISR